MNKSTEAIATRLHEAADAIARADEGRDTHAGTEPAERIEAEWARLKADISALVGNGALAETPEVTALLERLRSGIGRAGEALSETRTQARERVRRTAAEAHAYAHESPWKLAGAAAAAGLVVGVLLQRR